MLSPMLDKLSRRLLHGCARSKFVKINVDGNRRGTGERIFQVQAIPTLIFFRDGKVADRITGLPEEAELKGSSWICSPSAK